jgi:glycosyltransferase involved in cell wall biosynthesis
MIKICHLTSVHPSKDIRIFYKECTYLKKAGYDVSLIVANGDTEVENGVKIIGVKGTGGNRISRMIKGMNSVYKKALEVDADLYHFHDPELMIVGLLLKGKGKKVIYDVHEDVPEQVLSKQWIPGPFRTLISKMVKAFEKYSAKRFDGVVTATPTINNRFKTYNDHSVIVHNFPILEELIDPKLDLDNKVIDNTALYIGGITELRGIFEMVEAVGHANNKNSIVLKLAGKYAPASLEDEVKKKEAYKYVEHLGWLSRDQIKAELERALVGLVTLRPEPRYVVSYPIKMFEYMAAGLPVIASNFPLWNEIIKNENCGISVDPLNPEEIGNAINWLAENPKEALAMGKNGRKAIIEKYNWENEAETLVGIYKKLLPENQGELV